jgi:hypothetical protein
MRNNALARALRRIGLAAAPLEQSVKLGHRSKPKGPGTPTFGLTAQQPDEPVWKSTSAHGARRLP